MPKRAERRHHEERIKEKFRRVIKSMWNMPATLTGWAKMKRIEYEAVRAAHHNKCDCEMCHGQRYDRNHKKVLDKTYINEGMDKDD